MQTKLLNQAADQRTFAVILATGDEVKACLQRFAKDERVPAAQVRSIGALSHPVLKYLDRDGKKYLSLPVPEQVEATLLLDDFAEDSSGQLSVHIHVMLGKRGGTAMAGHLDAKYVSPALAVIITESPPHLEKTKDPASGLALINVGSA